MPAPKDSRPLTADPENEPDFYAISRKYPLPDDPDCCKLKKDLEGSAAAAAPALVSPASQHASSGRLAPNVSWLEQQMSASNNPVGPSLAQFCLPSLISPLAPPPCTPSLNNNNDNVLLTTAFLRAKAAAKEQESQPFALTNNAPNTAAALFALLNANRSSEAFPSLS